VGEESDLEMQGNGNGNYWNYGNVNEGNANEDNENEDNDNQQQHQGQDAEDAEVVSPISVVYHDTERDSSQSSLLAKVQDIMQRHSNSCNTSTSTSTSTNTIDHERVSVFIDPLDGTSSYAKGYYEAVTILVAIIVDNIPVFGVIVKPFQEGTHLPCFEQTGSSVIYGGTLIQGAFVMGKYVPNSNISGSGGNGSVSVSVSGGNGEFGNVVELERSRLWREHGSKIYQEQEQMTSTVIATPDTDVIKNKAPRMVSYEEEDIVMAMANEEKEQIRILDDPQPKRYRKVSPRIVTGFPRSTSSSSSPSSPIVDKRSDSTSSIASSPNLPIHTDANANANANAPIKENVQPPLLRAIISKSKGGGVVQNCIDSLSTKNLIHSQPLYITGAGYKTMKLVLGEENEGLWFFPKPGTSLWDVAAADALLRVMGGRISDKFGNDLDYSKGRLEADNLDGIIACCDERLHRTCLALYNEEKWDE